jgi:tetratricopeptide (TPR) repeat protein
MFTVGLSMIVKNGGEDLRKCLASARDVVQQIVIADTGSDDESVSIAREFGATVISFPWINDFAAARNAALQPITTDWVLVLDADEELDAAADQLLPPLLAYAGIGGYVLPIRNYLPIRFARMYNSMSQPNDGRNLRSRECPSFTEHLNCRLFRRHSEIYYEGRVHERVEDRVLACGLQMTKAELLLHHFGQLAGAEERLRKHIFYRDLGRAKVNEYPNSAMAWMELGLQEYENFNDHQKAMHCFQRAVELDPKRHDAWTFMAMIHADMGNPSEGLAALDNAGTGENGAALREQLRGDMLHNLGKLVQARAAYRRALKSDRNSPYLESKLGYTEVRLGMKQQGFGRMLRAISAAPEVVELQDRLVKGYVAVDDAPHAAEAAEKMAANFRSPKTILRAAGIRAHLREWPRAALLLESGLRDFPASAELKTALEQTHQAGMQ